jgi:type I restriction enzyme S subunit
MNCTRWKNVTLGEMLTFQRGFDITKKEQEDGAYPVISSSGTNSTHSAFKVKAPGVLIGRKGTLGKVFYSDCNFWPHDTTLWVKDFHGNEPKFGYYFLRTLGLEQYDCGASNPTLNRNHIHTLPIKWPPLDVQQRIAAILTVYDDLIENNTRRIKILEQMAQMLYREWFVNFRFLGHEKVKMVESEDGCIPDGWEVHNVEDVVTRVPSGKKYDQKTVSASGLIPVLDQGRSGIIGFHNDSPGVVATPNNPIIVFANHTCYQRLVMFSFSGIQNVLPFRSSAAFPRDIYWLHWVTKDLITFNDYKGHWPEFMSKRLVTPPADICSTFGKMIKPLVHGAYCLESKNNNLRTTRDLLLPKLVSGEVNIEQIEKEAVAQMV